ncbi:MAG TPA: four helix bundle protein [Pyrinomonadaceae bacterium]|nr:four helix bundle protein [Pyrinomonadaceae bacterium]
MKYGSFEELPVWRDAIELAILIFDLTSQPAFKGYYSVKDQLERAGVSVSNNIAEGFERGTTPETLTFLYISKGSSGEVRSLTYLLEHLGAFATLRSQVLNLRSRAAGISRQLHGWCSSLQNTEIKGHRYLTDKSRRIEKARRDREEFLKELEAMRSQN